MRKSNPAPDAEELAIILDPTKPAVVVTKLTGRYAAYIVKLRALHWTTAQQESYRNMIVAIRAKSGRTQRAKHVYVSGCEQHREIILGSYERHSVLSRQLGVNAATISQYRYKHWTLQEMREFKAATRKMKPPVVNPVVPHLYGRPIKSDYEVRELTVEQWIAELKGATQSH